MRLLRWATYSPRRFYTVAGVLTFALFTGALVGNYAQRVDDYNDQVAEAQRVALEGPAEVPWYLPQPTESPEPTPGSTATTPSTGEPTATGEPGDPMDVEDARAAIGARQRAIDFVTLWLTGRTQTDDVARAAWATKTSRYTVEALTPALASTPPEAIPEATLVTATARTASFSAAVVDVELSNGDVLEVVLTGPQWEVSDYEATAP